jgi:hypothetical protein
MLRILQATDGNWPSLKTCSVDFTTHKNMKFVRQFKNYNSPAPVARDRGISCNIALSGPLQSRASALLQLFDADCAFGVGALSV